MTGTMHGDGESLAKVEALIRSASLCVACLGTRSGRLVHDVELALRVLIRSREVEPAPACDSCRTGGPAFRATASNRDPPP